MRLMKHLVWPAALPLAIAAFATLGCATAAHASAVVTVMADSTPASAAALVQALLKPSSGLTVVPGSIQYTGAATASGTFVNGNGNPATGLGIDNGVVLSTGDARFISSSAAFLGDAANNTGTFTAGVGNALTENTSGGNAIFAGMTPEPTFNASVLSFDFVPLNDRLTLSFVFASEDYNDLVNSGFPTDLFAVFINGVNRALVPGTNLAVSASSIHCGGPTSGPAPGAGGLNCALYRDNAPFFDTIDSEVDGMTVLMNLSMAVRPGQVNRISIGVADNVDSFGDSAVLLAAGSVAAVPAPSTAALVFGALAAWGFATQRRRT